MPMEHSHPRDEYRLTAERLGKTTFGGERAFTGDLAIEDRPALNGRDRIAECRVGVVNRLVPQRFEDAAGAVAQRVITENRSELRNHRFIIRLDRH